MIPSKKMPENCAKNVFFYQKTAEGAILGWNWYCRNCDLQCAVSYTYLPEWNRYVETKICCTLGCRRTWKREND